MRSWTEPALADIFGSLSSSLIGSLENIPSCCPLPKSLGFASALASELSAAGQKADGFSSSTGIPLPVSYLAECWSIIRLMLIFGVNDVLLTG